MNPQRPNTHTPLTILLLNESISMGIAGVGVLGSIFIMVKRQFLPVFAPLFGNDFALQLAGAAIIGALGGLVLGGWARAKIVVSIFLAAACPTHVFILAWYLEDGGRVRNIEIVFVVLGSLALIATAWGILYKPAHLLAGPAPGDNA
ncbi:MAG: hypothetical protein M1527_00805 [Gammaproteobacteria bacterium]|nr:hypothetical protein [Gammaproteobacteria bacterium]